MKGFLLVCLSLTALTLGAPTPRSQDAVTAQELSTLRLFAQWSAAAGCNSQKSPGQPVTCKDNGCSMFNSHNTTVAASFIGIVLDTRGFIGIDPVDQLIVVSFRGSISVRNWIADFLFAQVPCDLADDCQVHAGFLASWAEVSSAVLAGVRAAAAAHPSYRVAVTGHSLGGAVGTLAAAYLRRAGHAADLYTYGSPRVGNAALAAMVTTGGGGKEYRVTHTDDPVPRLPPIVLGYRHTSPEYWLDAGGASNPAVTPADVRYCAGYCNVGCNGGTLGLDVAAHLWYFQSMTGCASGKMPFRRGAEAEISDAELEAKLNKYVELDKQAAAELAAKGQA